MRSALFNISFVRSSFWMLAFAWLCANSPQTACLEVFQWLARAKHFSHQERLVEGIKEVLAVAADETQKEALVAATESVPVSAPLIPPNDAVKKIELSTTVRNLEIAALRSEIVAWRASGPGYTALIPREVPYPPPRSDWDHPIS